MEHWAVYKACRLSRGPGLLATRESCYGDEVLDVSTTTRELGGVYDDARFDTTLNLGRSYAETLYFERGQCNLALWEQGLGFR